ncbi:MAG: NAD(+)/NADH kinase [Chloroflexi bacterium]|nr:MAG: NAD(+)/NADH kinase [Chloroflexota bacterium]
MIEYAGILYHPKIAATLPMAEQVSQWLQARGVQTWIASTEEETAINGQMDQFSLLIVLGGDGSTLRAARLSVPHGVPIFGINMGRIGFLSEANPQNWQERLTKVLEGAYWVENRLMLYAALQRQGQTVGTFTALNDIVVGRGKQARMLHLHLHVDGDLVTTYTADGLIVATPTGSTAYSMAVGGPLLPPQLQNFVVVPVAAHLSLDRALVLHEEAEITITVHMDHEAMLTADGQGSIDVADGDVVCVRKHENHCAFARVESAGYFYRRLMRRLGFHLSQG